ncbi:MAG TPA: dihydropteroate synthase [Verrucomicrobiota bacterium]|nr:dihydropteroate synthase [Verrucomicrobiota bacterium]HNT14389.1 dihydropteroate synthase [Verrucomicrobiota bacterium]
MGIVNVTPDSFADGGRFGDADRAIAHGLELVRQGAAILDIGGESSRPGAAPVSEAEELRRVIPVIEALARRVSLPLSIDTMKPAVARAALQAGASLVNDVGASCASVEMWELVAGTGAGYVAMHMQGLPRTMQLRPVYQDVVKEVGDFFAERMARLAAQGVACEQIVFDVGIGFGKNVAHNLQLLRALPGFTKLPRPMLLGVSRKSFIGALTGAPVAERLPGSLACASLAVAAGVQIIRTHDVAETVQAVRLAEAIREPPEA